MHRYVVATVSLSVVFLLNGGARAPTPIGSLLSRDHSSTTLALDATRRDAAQEVQEKISDVRIEGEVVAEELRNEIQTFRTEDHQRRNVVLGVILQDHWPELVRLCEAYDLELPAEPQPLTDEQMAVAVEAIEDRRRTENTVSADLCSIATYIAVRGGEAEQREFAYNLARNHAACYREQPTAHLKLAHVCWALGRPVEAVLAAIETIYRAEHTDVDSVTAQIDWRGSLCYYVAEAMLEGWELDQELQEWAYEHVEELERYNYSEEEIKRKVYSLDTAAFVRAVLGTSSSDYDGAKELAERSKAAAKRSKCDDLNKIGKLIYKRTMSVVDGLAG